LAVVKLSNIANGLIIVIASAIILIYTRVVLVPFVLAVIIWFMIRQVQRLIGRIKFHHRPLPLWLRGSLAFLSIFLVLGLMGMLLSNNIRGIFEVLPHYEQNVLLIKADLERSTGLDLTEYSGRITSDMEIGSILTTVLNAFTALLGNAFMVLIYVAFLMLEERNAKQKFMAMYKGGGRPEKALSIIGQVDRSLSQYVTLKTMVSLLTGALSFIALQIIGVDFAFFWAFLIFLLNYIPTIGSLIATIFPTLVAALQFASIGPALWVLASVGAIQVLVGNVLEPRLMGNSLNVSSLVVILSLAFWGSIWGVLGMILSVPITVMMVIIMAQFERTRWVAVMLSDRGRVGRELEEEVVG
jgi:AI-2 transport protein TqsA